jgi:linoleoyl-CoA desaturase
MSQELWFIDGKAYDLSEFVRRHPGGHDAIRLGQGQNCTELFRSYHFLRQPAAKLLARYEVEVDRSDPHNIERLASTGFTFAEDGFYKTVARRARAYFVENGKATRATPAWQLLSLAMVVGVVALTYPAFVLGSLWAAVALGFVRAMASIGPGHGMSHFSVFPRGRWNSLGFRLGSPLLVSSWAIWSAAHVRSHHVRTLTPDDLQDNYPLKRIQAAHPHRAWHRAQHIYIWLIYALGLPLWSLQDFVLSVLALVSRKHLTDRFTLRQRIENVLSIGFNLVFAVALPFFFLPPLEALAVCAITNVISSLLVVVQIVVNHEVPETEAAELPEGPTDWGAHQVLTSHNYGATSLWALHLSGGLNLQIEHHLFPSVHYTHYPKLQGIVREACREFGLPYHESKNVWVAMAKHHRLLKLRSVPAVAPLDAEPVAPVAPVVIAEPGA